MKNIYLVYDLYTPEPIAAFEDEKEAHQCAISTIKDIVEGWDEEFFYNEVEVAQLNNYNYALTYYGDDGVRIELIAIYKTTLRAAA